MENNGCKFFDESFLQKSKLKLKKAFIHGGTPLLVLIIELFSVFLFYSKTHHTAWTIITAVIVLGCGWMMIYATIEWILPVIKMISHAKIVMKSRTTIASGILSNIESDTQMIQGFQCKKVIIKQDLKTVTYFLIQSCSIDDTLIGKRVDFEILNGIIVGYFKGDEL